MYESDQQEAREHYPNWRSGKKKFIREEEMDENHFLDTNNPPKKMRW